MKFDKNEISADFATLIGTVNNELSVEDNILAICRAEKMQEFVQVPTKRELTMIVQSAISNLNAINPVTLTLSLSDYLADPNLYDNLMRMSLVRTYEMIIADYVHTGISDSSIEDIAIQDRQPRYEAYIQLLNIDEIKQNCANIKKAKGLGTDIEAGKAMGSITPTRAINDFDNISRF